MALSVTLCACCAFIYSYGGDVVKFAGDALMVLFTDPYTANTAGVSSEAEQQQRLRDCTHRALQCCVHVHKQFNEYSPVEGVVLKLHSGLSCGLIYGTALGCDSPVSRYEFLLEGEPVTELGPAMHAAGIGEIVMTQTAYQCIKDVIDAAPVSTSAERCMLYQGMLQQPTPYVTPAQHDYTTLCTADSPLSSFLLPTVLSRLLDQQGNFLAEFRRITTVFINLPQDVHLYSSEEKLRAPALQKRKKLINGILTTAHQNHGQLRQIM